MDEQNERERTRARVSQEDRETRAGERDGARSHARPARPPPPQTRTAHARRERRAAVERRDREAEAEQRARAARARDRVVVHVQQLEVARLARGHAERSARLDDDRVLELAHEARVARAARVAPQPARAHRAAVRRVGRGLGRGGRGRELLLRRDLVVVVVVVGRPVGVLAAVQPQGQPRAVARRLGPRERAWSGRERARA